MLHKLYNLLLKHDATAVVSRLGWGAIRKWLVGADPYWDVIEAVRTLGAPVFLDAGMHHGLYTDMILRKTNGVRVIGFEPTAESFNLLQKKYADESRVKVINCALGDRNGKSEFHCHANEQTNSLLTIGREAGLLGEMLSDQGMVTVDVKRLDSVLQELGESGPFFIKIDVQGAEQLVISGGAVAFAGAVKGCLVEMQLSDIYAGQADWQRVLGAVSSFGLKLWQLYPVMILNGEPVQFEALFLRQ